MIKKWFWWISDRLSRAMSQVSSWALTPPVFVTGRRVASAVGLYSLYDNSPRRRKFCDGSEMGEGHRKFFAICSPKQSMLFWWISDGFLALFGGEMCRFDQVKVKTFFCSHF